MRPLSLMGQVPKSNSYCKINIFYKFFPLSLTGFIQTIIQDKFLYINKKGDSGGGRVPLAVLIRCGIEGGGGVESGLGCA
ncbi:hypothetical protein A3E89_00650 [Candidatus Campbellbacteria bacterium RIFCSPHIGHO2_12_FULL_35_10]|uniref:Uncharacterized protein n=1 Tax=Candidatus Campbellbacteria bacterium RIFCSPHIGHO2_12_FULL_35_10 TaxID=1797578 RepID=A0A1F5EKC1_9BACT|nr:MAG: hypothetical protein A3E89_00650 [Candidatus Campbellbacteria bacterium RIFCSPHIGHO2_12_FULL_35_10]